MPGWRDRAQPVEKKAAGSWRERAIPANKPPEMEVGDSAISALASGLTYGFSDEMGAGIRAGVDKVASKAASLVEGQDVTSDFGESYDKYLNEQRGYKAKAQKDNPYTFGAANLVGNIASPASKFLAPAKGAGALSVMGRGAAGGALLGAGESNARLTDSPDKALEFAGDVAGGAALGGAAGGLFYGGGKALSALRPEALRAAAGERAVKAATGQNLKTIRNLRATGAADDTGDALSMAGRNMLSKDTVDGKDLKPLLGWTSRAEGLLPGLTQRQDIYGKEIGKVAGAIDEAMPGAVDGKKISQRILDYAAKMPETEQTKPVIERLLREAQRYETKGAMSFAEAQALKGAYKFKPMDSSTHAFGQDASNKLNSILRTEMNDTAKMIAQTAPKGSQAAELAGKYGDLKGKFQTYKTLGEAAQKRADANLSNRFSSPTDYGSAGLGVLASAMHGGSAGTTAAVGLAAGLANKIARERGSAFAAKGMNALAGVLERSPQALGKFGGVIESAASRGAGSLLVTHQMLMKDPEYRKIVEGQP